MKTLFLILSAISLCSCVVHRPAANWHKNGVSQTDAQTKYSRCVYDVGMNKVDVIQQQTLISACMEADGFRWGVSNTNY
ncbi:hypothetical protein [Lonepinella sp. MS14437]|uniref:hypothetical protein n=1 Tax=Lonepinella sp. MS14437 TaxID=3003620 RepID=UPI0036DBBBB0